MPVENQCGSVHPSLGQDGNLRCVYPVTQHILLIGLYTKEVAVQVSSKCVGRKIHPGVSLNGK